MPGQVTRHNGVIVDGPINLPASVPFHASQMYSKNMLSLAKLLLSGGRGSPWTSRTRSCVAHLWRTAERSSTPAVLEALAPQAA